MRNGMNKVIVAGTLGADAELRQTQGGQSVANFRIAVNESWFDKAANERKERVEWISIVYWGAGAQAISQWLVKGKDVLIEGRLQTRSWEKDGVKRYSTEVNASQVILLGGGQSQGDSSERSEPPKSRGAQGSFDSDEDVPF